MTGFNLTELPEVFGEILGLSLEPSAVLISIVGLAIISLCLALVDLSNMGIAICDISWLTFATYLGWFPIWIMIIIVLIIAVLFARKVVSYSSGNVGE